MIDQLEEIQQSLFRKAQSFQKAHIKEATTKEEFYNFFKSEKGFISAHWAGNSQDEEKLQKDLNVTIRCIPTEGEKKEGICPFTKKKSKCRVIFAKSY